MMMIIVITLFTGAVEPHINMIYCSTRIIHIQLYITTSHFNFKKVSKSNIVITSTCPFNFSEPKIFKTDRIHIFKVKTTSSFYSAPQLRQSLILHQFLSSRWL